MEPFVRQFNLDNRRFVLSEVHDEQGRAQPPAPLIVFSFHQCDGVLVGSLQGEGLVEGRLLATLVAADRLEAVFHCLPRAMVLASGRAVGVIGGGPRSKLTLHLDWEWLSGRSGRGVARFTEI